MKYVAKRFIKQNFYPTKRHKKTRMRYLPFEVEVDITEPTTEEFPVAFIVSDYNSVETREGESDYRLCDTEIRVFNGQLYSAVMDCRGALIKGFEPIDEYLSRQFVKTKPSYYGDNSDEFDENDSIICSDTSDSEKGEVLEQARGILIFDSKVWETCGEPVYNIMTFGMGRNHGGTSLSVDIVRYPESANGKIVNALNREMAINIAVETALGRGDTEYVDSIKNCKENIQVLMPEMVKIFNVDLLPKGAHYCPHCGNTTRFKTVAHVAQNWVVDGMGALLKVADADIGTVAPPSSDNPWICCDCRKDSAIKE